MDTIDIRSRIVEEGKLNRQLWKQTRNKEN